MVRRRTLIREFRDDVMNRSQIDNAYVILATSMLMAGGAWLNGCSSKSPPPAASSNRQPAPAPPAPPPPRKLDGDVSSHELATWPLGEEESKSLGLPFRMKQFEIRPPANFRYIDRVSDSQKHYWIGPIREDETYPQLIVIIAELPAGEASAPLPNLLKDVMAAIKQLRKDWSATPAEQGRINGLPFIRSTWSGVATGASREGLAGRTMHGIVYLTVHENTVIQIMCQDAAPDYAQWLKAGESAALSFRLAPP
jgi:hypothetical protein